MLESKKAPPKGGARKVKMGYLRAKGSELSIIGLWISTHQENTCAFEQCCVALQIGTFDDEAKQALANKLVELANTGERHPDRLCEGAMKEMIRPMGN